MKDFDMGDGKGTMLGEFMPHWASGTHRTTQGYNAHEGHGEGALS